jgi:hypothetical protein
MHFQTYTDPTKQLMLEVVDGPSVRFLFNFNILLKLSFILYLQLTFLSARVKTDASTIEKRRTNIFFIMTKNTVKFYSDYEWGILKGNIFPYRTYKAATKPPLVSSPGSNPEPTRHLYSIVISTCLTNPDCQNISLSPFNQVDNELFIISFLKYRQMEPIDSPDFLFRLKLGC